MPSRFLIVAAIALRLLGPASAQSAAPRAIAYTFDLRDPARAHVSLTFTPGAGGTEKLHLPNSWAGQDHLDQAIQNLHALDSSTVLTSTKDLAIYNLISPAGRPVHLAYDLVQDWSGPLRHPNEHRVVLEPGFFDFNGLNALVYPAFDDHQQIDLSLRFTLAPADTLITSFGTATIQHFRGEWQTILEALFTGGQIRTQRITVEDKSVLIGIHGIWTFPPQEVADKVRTILATERRFWHDTESPYFAVVLGQYETGSGSSGGSGFTNVFNFFLGRDAPFDTTAESLFAHEAFHRWVPGGLGYVNSTSQIAWFGEGFTRYYQDILLVRAGLMNRESYLARLNTTLRDYQLSPAIKLTNNELRNAKSDPTTEQEPYLRGAVLALWLNYRIQQQTAGRFSVDDYLFALRDRRAEPLTEDRIFSTAARFVDGITVTEYRRYALDGTPIPILAGSLGPCTALETEHTHQFDLGFSERSLVMGGTVNGLHKASAAYAAGLRTGMKFKGFSVYNGNPDREVTLTMQAEDGSTQKLRYLPHGAAIDIVQVKETHCPR